MALWGNKDGVVITGTSISVTNASTAVTGTGTTFLTDLKVGDVLQITSGTTTKNRVAAIASNTVLTLADNFTGTTAATLSVTTTATVALQQQPKSVYQNGNTTGTNSVGGGKAGIEKVFGVDVTEARVAANRAKGINTPGWTSFATYTDAQGNTRRKVECLVAMNGMTQAVAGDAADDTVVADT